MGNSNQQFSHNIQYTSTLNIDDVLAKIKQLEREVNNKHPNVDILNIDNEIANLERLKKKYQEAMAKGFSSRDDIKNINYLGNQIENTLNKIDRAFDKADYNIAKDAKNALRDTVRGIREELNKNKNLFNTNFNQLFEGIKNKGSINAMFREAIKSGNDFTSVQKQVLSNLDSQIEKSKEVVKSISGTTFSDLNNFKENPFAYGIQLPTNIWKRDNGKNDTNNYEAIKRIFVEIAQSEGTAEKKLEEFKTRLAEVGVAFKNENYEFKWFENYSDMLENLEDQAAKVLDSKEYQNATRNLQELEDQYTIVENNLNNTNLQNSFNSWSQASEEIKEVTKQLDNFDENAYKIERNGLDQSFDSLTDAITKEKYEVDGLVNAQTRLDNTFNGLQSRLTQLLSIGTAYTELRKIIRETYNDVKELDKAFGEIAMVTDYSVSDLWSQYGNYAKMANDLGQSTTSVIQASGLFYQQGLNAAEALTLTEDTMKLATLAGLDFSNATSQMTAALRAFHMEMDEGSHITDVYAELAANAAADVQGIATAMSKTASIANSAGMSFENTATFLTTMIEATQEAPDNIGTALKTVIAR